MSGEISAKKVESEAALGDLLAKTVYEQSIALVAEGLQGDRLKHFLDGLERRIAWLKSKQGVVEKSP